MCTKVKSWKCCESLVTRNILAILLSRVYYHAGCVNSLAAVFLFIGAFCVCWSCNTTIVDVDCVYQECIKMHTCVYWLCTCIAWLHVHAAQFTSLFTLFVLCSYFRRTNFPDSFGWRGHTWPPCHKLIDKLWPCGAAEQRWSMGHCV